MNRIQHALQKTLEVPPQTKVEVVRGVQLRRTRAGIPVVSIHYSADPERDPNQNPEWKKRERAKYTSQAAWDREQEIIDNAGGGELVLADTLITHWDKIVITAPEWRPSPTWRCDAGFDHGKTNPTSMLRSYHDHDGVIYLCGEYYQPGKEIWEHVQALRKFEDIRKVENGFADPSIFYQTNQQSTKPGEKAQQAKSVNELYVEQGIELFSPFAGDRSDVSYAARLMTGHWADLERRAPSLRIVCRNYSERPQPGMHQWDCPNLLWEMMRWKRVKLTAQQALTRNASEAIVDKDNHAIDASKYLVMSYPEPTIKSAHERAAEKVAEVAQAGDLTSSAIRYAQAMEQLSSEGQPARLGRYRR